MNTVDEKYHAMLEQVLESNKKESNRTVTDQETLSVSCIHNKYDLREGFPIITTKRIFFRGIIEELLFFLSGSSDTKILEEKNVNFWKADTAHTNGDMGKGYGAEWRDFNGEGVDQIKNLENNLNNNPSSRRHIVSAWNPARVHLAVLPPCHHIFQLITQTENDVDYLDLSIMQRSGDIFLGIPFNISSYALLLTMLAHVTNRTPRYLFHTINEAHIYSKHVSQCKEQLKRESFPLPTLELVNPPLSTTEFTIDNFKLHNYKSHGKLPAPMAHA